MLLGKLCSIGSAILDKGLVVFMVVCYSIVIS